MKLLQDEGLRFLRDVVRTNPEEAFEKCIWEAGTWPMLYHLASSRRNLIEWLPMLRSRRVLEVGAECGALTGLLMERGEEVTALEISEKKAEILSLRYPDRENLRVMTGPFSALPEGEGYDLIVAAGSLPLAKLYFPEEKDPYLAFLSALQERLLPGGQLVLACPNRLGLKYLAGTREDYTGAPFTGVEGYHYHPEVHTFGRNGLKRLLWKTGFRLTQWYYPYPDWRFPTALYSGRRLPGPGELHRNLEVFDQERYVLFDETLAYDALLEEGMFPELANSFLVVCGKGVLRELPVFVKYSTERAREYALRTEITREGRVRKVPICPEGEAHLKRMGKAREILEAEFEGSMFEILPCAWVEGGVDMPQQKGRSLQEILENLAAQGRDPEIDQILNEFRGRLELFSVIHDLDLTFGNLFVPDGVETPAQIQETPWTVIDYEWTSEEPVPTRYILYRTFFLASAEIRDCKALNWDVLKGKLCLTEEEEKAFAAREAEFQARVLGDALPVRDMTRKINPGIVPLAWMDDAYRKSLERKEPAETEQRKGFSMFRWRKG